MKRNFISLLVAGLFAVSAATALAQNVTADEKAGTTPKTVVKDQKEMTNPQDDQAATPAGDKASKPEDVSNAYSAALKKCAAMGGAEKAACEKKAKSARGKM